MNILPRHGGISPDNSTPTAHHLGHMKTDVVILGSVFDFPAKDAVKALESLPFDALTIPGQTIAQATLAHARELAQNAPTAPLSVEVVSAALNARGELLDTDNGTRTMIASIPGVNEGRFHFPHLLTALKQRHYRETFKAAVSTLSVIDADTISLEELTHVIQATTEQLRQAYVGAPDDTVTNINTRREASA